MNYFFFLENKDKNFDSKIDVFNLPPMRSFHKVKLKKKIIKVFFVNNLRWEFVEHDHIFPYEIKTYYLSKFKKKYGNYSFFIGLFDLNQDIFKDHDYMVSQPTWRSNICIKTKFSSASYQGEIPLSLTIKNISLVSCSPMTQSQINIRSYFYLVNLFHEPINEVFTVDVYNNDKKKIGNFNCLTNQVNSIDITHFSNNNDLLIFKSKKHGGVPLYFHHSVDYKYLSLEHTHPPVEYVYSGNRFNIQKEKKKYWFQF